MIRFEMTSIFVKVARRTRETSPNRNNLVLDKTLDKTMRLQLKRQLQSTVRLSTATRMALHITGSKKTRILFLCLLLLAVEVISGPASSAAKSKLGENKGIATNDSDISTVQTQVKGLVSPIPSVISKLGRLASTSLQEIDTIFKWPTGIPKKVNTKNESTPSPLIEYPKSYQTTLLQIIQKLTNVLRSVNRNTNEMAMELISAPDYIDTLIRYLSHYPQKTNALGKLLALPLNRLQKLSEKITLLSSKSVSEFQGVANLTKAVAETAKDILSAKTDYLNNSSNSSFSEYLATKMNYKEELVKNITSFYNEYQRWYCSLTDLESKIMILNNNDFKFNQKKTAETKLNAKSEVGQKIDNSNCVERRQATLNNKNERFETEEELTVSLKLEERALKEVENISRILTNKREEHYNVSIAMQKLKRKKKRLEQDVYFLANTLDLINSLVEEMEKLVVGWNNLANCCLTIQTDLANARASLLDRPTEHINKKPLNNLNQPLEDKIREGMDVVSKIVKFFVKVYDSNLSSLAAQLNQIMSTRNEDLITLENNLIQVSTNISLEINEMLIKVFPPP